MNFTVSGNDLYAYHNVSNVEFSGFLDKYKIHGYSFDYHLFIKYGDKVYMEVNGNGEIVISFAELQKNKHWKHYYDLSLMLTNNKHTVIQDLVYNSKECDPYNIYKEERYWSITTAYIDDGIRNDGRYDFTTKKITENEYNCYYRINPFDLEKMEYASPQYLDVFKRNYMSRYEVKSNSFVQRVSYFYTIVLDYQACLMEKELDELTAIFEDKKNMVNLVALNDIEGMNGDVLRTIYNHIVGVEGHKRYSGIIDKIDNCKNKLERDVEILEA